MESFLIDVFIKGEEVDMKSTRLNRCGELKLLNTKFTTTFLLKQAKECME